MSRSRKVSAQTAAQPARSANPAGFRPADAPAWALAALATLIVAAVYVRAAGFEFVNLDDFQFIQQNPHIMAGLTPEGLRWAFGINDTNYWQPLTWVSLMLDSSLYAEWAGGYHLTNVLLHCANVLLLFRLILRWTGQRWTALAVALLFGLHPAHVESVAWITERKDVLFLFFGLLCLHAYTSHARRRAQGLACDLGGGLRSLAPALLAHAASLAAKPMLVTLPVLLLLLDYWPLRRTGWSEDGQEAGRTNMPAQPGLPALLLEKLPFLVLALTASAITLASHPEAYDSFDPGMALKLSNAVASYLDYLRILVFPAGLAAFYPYPQSVPVVKLGAAMAILVCLSAAALQQARRRPFLPVCWFWFLVTLLPVLIPPKVGMHVAYADRWLYLPAIGLYLGLVLLAGEALSLLGKQTLRRRAALAAGAALCAGLALLSGLQLEHWRNSFTLYERALAVTDENTFIMDNYGVIKMRQGDFAAAERWMRAGLAIQPGNAKARFNLAVLYTNMRRYENALPHFTQAIKGGNEPVLLHDAWYYKGLCLSQLGRYDEAERCYLAALRYDANHPQTYNDLGTIALLRNQLPLAVEYLTKAVALAPGYDVARMNLARAKAALGETP